MLRCHVPIVSQNTFYFLVNLFLDGRKSRQIIQPPQSSVRCLQGKEAKKKTLIFPSAQDRILLFHYRLAVYMLFLVTLRKVFRRASCNALRWDKVNTIRRVCISQYLTVVSFHLDKPIIYSDQGWNRKVRYWLAFLVPGIKTLCRC